MSRWIDLDQGPIFRVELGPEGDRAVVHLARADWPSRIVVLESAVTISDPEYCAFGDGLLRLWCYEGSALYGLVEVVNLTGMDEQAMVMELLETSIVVEPVIPGAFDVGAP